MCSSTSSSIPVSQATTEPEHALPLRKCPVCRARLVGDEPPDQPCRRCGSDLSLLRAVHHHAARHRRLARRALARGEVETALDAAKRAVALLDTKQTRATLAAALAAADRLQEALAVIDVRGDSSTSPF